MKYSQLETSIGTLTIAADDQAVAEILFASRKPPAEWVEGKSPILKEALHQLQSYFEGRITSFNLPLAPQGTLFQRTVWSELQNIPYGATISYGELARRIGNSSASRAVGAANGQNPIPIVIPCHRVIGANGSLTGFGGGLPIKKALLALESRQGALL